MERNAVQSGEDPVRWVRLVIGLIAVFALFQWKATALGSDRGQFGVMLGLLVVAATLLAEKILFGQLVIKSFKTLGLLLPNKKGILIGIGICFLMLLAVFIFALTTNSTFRFYPGWYFLIAGLFFQAGIAEETLFRGYLFGHIRQRYGFWKAAVLAAIPFILVHLILLFSLPWPIAAGSILLSVIVSFPLARLFELGGNTIWPPAILHFVVQGTVKILIASGESAEIFPLFWIIVCALIPLLVFVLPKNLLRKR